MIVLGFEGIYWRGWGGGMRFCYWVFMIILRILGYNRRVVIFCICMMVDLEFYNFLVLFFFIVFSSFLY